MGVHSQTIGLTFYWLHLLPALVGLFVALYLLWTVAMRERKTNSTRLTSPSTTTTFVSQFWKRLLQKGKGSARVERVWVTAVVMTSSVLIVYAATRPPKYPIVEEHNIAVLGQLGDGDWAMHSDEEGAFAYRPCKDFDVNPMFSMALGYVAPRARWEERGDCKSIRATGLGFWWRNNKGEYVGINKEAGE